MGEYTTMRDLRMHGLGVRPLAILLALIATSASSYGEPIAVKYPQGSAHGFLEIRTVEGQRIAMGDYAQTVRGGRVISRTTFHFLDGSIDDETTVFTQNKVFALVSDHHVQRGPAFPVPLDVEIEAKTGQVTSITPEGKRVVEHLDLPADLANGLPPNLLLNISPEVSETRVSYVAPTAKPRLIHISIKPAGELRFKVAGVARKATDYVVHVEPGGLTGIIAPIVGKQPRDLHIYIMGGTPPAFIREEGQFYLGGPVWRVEQTSPVFSQ
jgi:hypothetical protein